MPNQIDSYLNQIQSILLRTLKHYKTLISYGRGLDEKLETLEEYFSHPFSDELKTFLNWSCVNPAWGAPFFSFDPDGKKYQIWTHRAKIISIHLERTPADEPKKLEIMWGEFVAKVGSKRIFKVYVDIEGHYTKQKESIFLEYGESQPNYSDNFDPDKPVHQVTLADNITDFAQRYLKHLKTIPIKPKVFKKIDRLLEDPKKLYKYVAKYNWDDGEEELQYIINHPKCDKATALLIYWLSQPHLFDDATCRELELIPYVVEKNFEKDFYQDSDNHFDPTNNLGTNFLEEYETAGSRERELPRFMLKAKV